MKNKIFTVAVVAALVMVTLCIGTQDGGQTTTPDGGASTVEEIQLEPPTDYIDELKAIIEGDEDPYTRETALLAMTEIALRKGDSEEIVDYLKDIATEEEDEDVRTSAYVAVDLIRDRFPLEPKGSLELSVEGEMKTGETITLVATVSSTVPQEIAIVGITSLPDEIELVSAKGHLKFPLEANEEKEARFDLKLAEWGEYDIPVTLMLSFDAVDYEKVQEELHIAVE